MSGMAVALLAGAGLGLGVSLLVAGLSPAPLSVVTVLRHRDHPTARTHPHVATASPVTRQGTDRARAWLGSRLAGNDGKSTGATGDRRHWALSAGTNADLAVTGTPAQLHAGAKVLAALTGLLVPAACAWLLTLLGLAIPILIPLWLSLTTAAIGFLLPDLRLRGTAADSRRVFRTCVGAYLDLVAMRMASGSGLAEALHDAASIGAGPAFAQIRGALADARTDGLTPAQALGRLGEQLVLPDLVDISTRLRLVDASGAQAQASLRAQAASLRDRELSDAQGRAGEQSQSMLVAQVVLGVGFMIFLGYPAVARVLAT